MLNPQYLTINQFNKHIFKLYSIVLAEIFAAFLPIALKEMATQTI
jgi:hypothetical protein